MHSWDCPTDYEARRRAERDYDRGNSGRDNPYRSRWDDDGCEDAARTYDRAYRDAERRDEERREEEAAVQRRAERRREEEAHERQQLEQMQYDERYSADEEARINAEYAEQQAQEAAQLHGEPPPSDEIPW